MRLLCASFYSIDHMYKVNIAVQKPEKREWSILVEMELPVLFLNSRTLVQIKSACGVESGMIPWD